MQNTATINLLPPPSAIRRLFVVAVYGGIVLYLMGQVVSSEPRHDLMLLTVLALLQLLPLAIFLWRGGMNALVLILLVHLFSFTFASKILRYFIIFEEQRLPRWALASVVEHIHCTAIVILTYYMARWATVTVVNRYDGKPFRFLDIPPTYRLACYALILFLPVILIVTPSSLHGMLTALNLLATVLVLTIELRGSLFLVFFWRFIVFLASIVYFIQTGSLGAVGTFIMVTAVSMLLQEKWRQLLLIPFLAMVLIQLQSMKHIYRQMIWTGESINFGEKVQYFSLALQGGLEEGFALEDLIDDEEEELLDDKPKASALMRFSDDSMERVLEYTPSRVPFWNGETYEMILFIFIPRLIYPEKPSRVFGNKFGKEYGFLDSFDNSTSIAVNIFAEGYMNFGHIGMYMVAIIFGLLVLAFEVLSIKLMKEKTIFGFIIFSLPLMILENDMSGVVGGSLQATVLVFALRKFIVKTAK